MVPDPRSSIEVTLHTYEERFVQTMSIAVGGEWRLEDSPRFGAETDSFPPHACGSCDLWECNATERYATWVYRFGPHVFWIYANSDIYVFDLVEYDRALSAVHPDETARNLPELDQEKIKDRLDPIPYGDVGWIEDIPGAGTLFEWPRYPFDGVVAVAPPISAIEVEPGLWFGRTESEWSMFLVTFPLPTWLAGPRITDLAIFMLHQQA